MKANFSKLLSELKDAHAFTWLLVVSSFGILYAVIIDNQYWDATIYLRILFFILIIILINVILIFKKTKKENKLNSNISQFSAYILATYNSLDFNCKSSSYFEKEIIPYYLDLLNLDLTSTDRNKVWRMEFEDSEKQDLWFMPVLFAQKHGNTNLENIKPYQYQRCVYLSLLAILLCHYRHTDNDEPIPNAYSEFFQKLIELASLEQFENLKSNFGSKEARLELEKYIWYHFREFI